MDLIITIALLIIAISIITKGKITIEIVHTDNPQNTVPTDTLEGPEGVSKQSIDDFVNSINNLMGVNQDSDEE